MRLNPTPAIIFVILITQKGYWSVLFASSYMGQALVFIVIVKKVYDYEKLAIFFLASLGEVKNRAWCGLYLPH